MARKPIVPIADSTYFKFLPNLRSCRRYDNSKLTLDGMRVEFWEELKLLESRELTPETFKQNIIRFLNTIDYKYENRRNFHETKI